MQRVQNLVDLEPESEVGKEAQNHVALAVRSLLPAAEL
jgi:hypothetical protein